MGGLDEERKTWWYFASYYEAGHSYKVGLLDKPPEWTEGIVGFSMG